MTGAWPEIVMTSAGFLGLIAYHTHLFYKVRHSPLETSIGITKRMRRDWVQVVMENNHDILDFFFAFFNFALSIRYYNHASFAINVPPSRDPLITYDTVSGIINHGHIHYTLGMRGYYLAVPLTLWLFGPAWILAGSIVLIAILYKLDRTA